MRAINHHHLPRPLLSQRFLCGLYALRIVVRLASTSTKNHEPVLVAGGRGDGSEALFRDTHEMVRRCCCTNSVNGDGHSTVRAIFEPDREGETTGELSVQLAFCSTGADGTE